MTTSDPATVAAPQRAAGSGLARLLPGLTLAALVLLAFNLRSPLTALPPVLATLRADLGIGATLAGLLTSIPVLCFGLLTPLASMLIGRLGIEKAVMLTLAGAALGALLRPAATTPALLGGTLLLGAALTVGNIVSLMVVARDFPQRMGMVTGIYTAALNIGTMLTAALTAPLALWLGWRAALASWADLALLAALPWLLILRWRPASAVAATAAPAATAAGVPRAAPCRTAIAWLLGLALALHLFIYYSITAWLPTYLIEVDGMAATRAGLVASAFQILALTGSFGVPFLARRFSLSWQLAWMGGIWLVTVLAMWLAPRGWPLWCLSGGIAQGGTFVVVFMLIMRHAVTLDYNRKLSTFVQGIGYCLAAAGPVAIGWFHEHFRLWRSSFLLLAALCVGLVLVGVAVARGGRPSSRVLPAPARP